MIFAGWRRAAVLVVVSDPNAAQQASAEALRQLFDLSQRSRLGASTAAGRTVAE